MRPQYENSRLQHKELQDTDSFWGEVLRETQSQEPGQQYGPWRNLKCLAHLATADTAQLCIREILTVGLYLL